MRLHQRNHKAKHTHLEPLLLPPPTAVFHDSRHIQLPHGAVVTICVAGQGDGASQPGRCCCCRSCDPALPTLTRLFCAGLT